MCPPRKPRRSRASLATHFSPNCSTSCLAPYIVNLPTLLRKHLLLTGLQDVWLSSPAAPMVARRHPAPDGPFWRGQRTEGKLCGYRKLNTWPRLVKESRAALQRKVASLWGKLRAPAKVLRITIIDRGDYTSYIMLLAFIPNVTLQRGEPVDDHREKSSVISRVEQLSVAFARP